MAQPPTYNRAYNFTDFAASNPTTPPPGNKLDEEFSRIKAVIDAFRVNLAVIQRDDTALANVSVGYDQLKAELDGFGFNPPSEWATATNYVVRDTVFHDNGFYRCAESHTSGTFSTDLTAEKWVLIADFTQATTDAEAAKDAAETAQAAAEAAQTAAETAETNAASSASAAATSASNAATSATEAAASAATAATLIGGTVTEAVRHDIAQGLDNTQKTQARANIGVVIGTDVQAYDADTAKLDVAQSWTGAQTIPDDKLLIVDPVDATKKVRVDAGNVTAGQTRALTMRNADLDLANVFTSVVRQVFTSSGTYTPTSGMKFCIVDAIGGGGGGGAGTSGGGSAGGGGGGGGGARAVSRLTAAQVGASQTVTIGSGGTGGLTGSSGGGSGGQTSLGSLVTADGGSGGGRSVASAGGAGGNGGSSGTGDHVNTGAAGHPGSAASINTISIESGSGASTPYGAGGKGATRFATGADVGVSASGYGAGGGGGTSYNETTGAAGGNGRLGIVIITEFVA